MSPSYVKLLNDFKTGTDIMSALVANNPTIYFFITEIIMLGSNVYRNIETREGREVAGKMLMELLIVFRRQIKYQKIEIGNTAEKLYIDKTKMELSVYLDQLLSLIYDISNYTKGHNPSGEIERKLINGQGYQNILKLKGSIIKSLYSFGCQNDDDKEEIFNECLIIFWQKLVKNEIGFYISGKADKSDNYHVFNRKFYQNSKLSTYLIGIAKNIFMNRIKSIRVSEPVPEDLPSPGVTDHDIYPTENPLVFMFLFYRVFMEPRKLRTVISILQYDCNLEDREVRQLLGINNARIHSSRLRNNFHEWYGKNKDNSHFYFDKASAYLNERELKTSKLNEKIRVITSFRQTTNLWKINLGEFREEFRTLDDFRKFHQIFRYLIYLSYIGKPSNLAGLPDEKLLRELMELYKNGVFGLPGYQSIIYLFYYASDEPANTIISLLKELCNEMSEMDQNPESVTDLVIQFEKNSIDDLTDLTNKIFETNCILFSHFQVEKEFLNRISKNESGQRIF